jgi:uncharacterized protein
MYSDGAAPPQLTRDECLTLLASVPVGRIVFTRRALPDVELVGFVLDRGEIVIRIDRDAHLAAAAGGAVVAFEADLLDVAGQTGWSVTAIGPAREVTDQSDQYRLRTMGLSSLAPVAHEHFIRVSPQILSGRRLRAHAGQTAA